MQSLLAQQSLAQQSLTAAASLNPGLLGLSANTFLPSSGFSSLWSNQLTAAAIVQQQQEATRKVLESANGTCSSLLGWSCLPIDGSLTLTSADTAIEC